MANRDENTAFVDMHPQSYCTLDVLTALAINTSLSIGIVSHDRKWARHTLGRRFRRYLLRPSTQWDDMGMLLSARRGIV